MTSASTARVAVGVFGAPHGVRGEMRLKSFTGDPLAIIDYAPLTDKSGQRRFVLNKARLFKDDLLIVSVEGVADRDAAAKLTNLEVFASRDLMPDVEDDEFYHADLIGLQAKDASGKVIGFVIAMHNFGAGDIIEIKPIENAQTLMLPFTKAIVPHIDLTDETITIVMPDEIESEEEPKA